MESADSIYILNQVRKHILYVTIILMQCFKKV